MAVREDPRIGPLRSLVDDLRRQTSDKDSAVEEKQAQIDDLQDKVSKIEAELDAVKLDDAEKSGVSNSLGAKLGELQKAGDNLVTGLDSLQSGMTEDPSEKSDPSP